jgi:hypothetical protein
MEQVGLIKVEKSTVASTLTFPCIRKWRFGDTVIVNPYRGSLYTDECGGVKGE